MRQHWPMSMQWVPVLEWDLLSVFYSNHNPKMHGHGTGRRISALFSAPYYRWGRNNCHGWQSYMYTNCYSKYVEVTDTVTELSSEVQNSGVHTVTTQTVQKPICFNHNNVGPRSGRPSAHITPWNWSLQSIMHRSPRCPSAIDFQLACYFQMESTDSNVIIVLWFLSHMFRKYYTSAATLC